MLSALKAVRYCYGPDILHHATPELLDDAGFAADAIMTKAVFGNLRFSVRLQTDPRVCLLHKVTNQRLLPDPVLSDDTEVAMLQIKMWDRAHEATPWDFSDDHECCLQHVSERLQGDKEFVLAAVEYDGMSLKHAAGPLRNDPDVVRAAVQQNGMALGFASEKEEEEEEEEVCDVGGEEGLDGILPPHRCGEGQQGGGIGGCKCLRLPTKATSGRQGSGAGDSEQERVVCAVPPREAEVKCVVLAVVKQKLIGHR